MTVRDFAERWLTDYPRRKQSTNERLAENVQALMRLCPGLGARPLYSIKRNHAFHYAKQHSWLYPTLRAMFGDAVREGLIETNPFSNLRIKRSRGRKDILPLTNEEVARLAAAAQALHPALGINRMILAAAYTGLRPGELGARARRREPRRAIHSRQAAGLSGQAGPAEERPQPLCRDGP